jgi:hypothetical protein
VDRTFDGKLFGRSVKTIHPEALSAEVSTSNTEVGDTAPNFFGGFWMILQRRSQYHCVASIDTITYVIPVKHCR